MFVAALVLVVGWLVTGPFFQFGEMWNFFINTTTTVITFLMVFVLQNSQNAHTEDIQAKLDRIEKMLIESNRRETPRDP